MPTCSIAASNTLPGRPDKGLARQILLVARLLADEHDIGIARPLAEHRLRRVLVERAAPAALHRRARIGEAEVIFGLLLGLPRPAAPLACRWCDGGWLAVRSIMSCSASLAPRIRGAMSSASGRLRQYLTAISDFIIATLSRAGLKIEAK